MKTPARILALSLTSLLLSAAFALADNPPPPPPVQPYPDLPQHGDGNPPDQPLPPPQPVPPPAPGVTDLCQASYQGSFQRHRDPATLAIQGGDFVLHGNGQDYHGVGACQATSASSASFEFTLDDDARYVFRGSIQLRDDGSALVSADEVKAGQVVDHLVLSGASAGN